MNSSTFTGAGGAGGAGGFMKNQYKGTDCQFIKGGLTERGGGVFEGN